jgi:Ca-activated chloride channel homolog
MMLSCLGVSEGADVKTWCAILGMLMVLAPAAAQEATTPVGTTFRGGVDLVSLNVVVTDGHQKFVTGLDASDFIVLEDGVPQDISFFASSALPLDLAVMLDTSASMTDKMATMQQAAVGFASTLGPSDRISIVELKEKVTTLHPLNSDVAGAIDRIKSTRAGGGTSLYNGLYVTLREMARQQKLLGDQRRQALAVLSDGDDTSSMVTFDDVLELAKRSGISIYTITLKGQGAAPVDNSAKRFFSQTEFSMKSLAQETGGLAFFPSQIGELAGIYDTIATELGHQYAIGYSSRNIKRDGGYRRVMVRVDRPDARARARAGYLAARGVTDAERP